MIPGFGFFRLGLVVAAIMFLSGVAWKLHHSGVVSGRAELQLKWDAERAEATVQAAALRIKAAQETADLQTKADQLKKAKDVQINKLNADLAGALERLRDRPERPSAGSVPSDAGAGANTGCTGAQLYRPDSGFLVRLAARADRLRADLAQCQTQYNAARDALTPR